MGIGWRTVTKIGARLNNSYGLNIELQGLPIVDIARNLLENYRDKLEGKEIRILKRVLDSSVVSLVREKEE
jgi:hypothetical protein